MKNFLREYGRRLIVLVGFLIQVGFAVVFTMEVTAGEVTFENLTIIIYCIVFFLIGDLLRIIGGQKSIFKSD